MSKSNKMFVLTLISFALASLILTFSGAERASVSAAQEQDEDPFPIATFDEPDTTDPKIKFKRDKRNKRYDNWKIVNATTEGGGMTVNSEIEYPALPVLASDAIVIGEVTDVQAYLSNDKGGVYSEFASRVDEVFKQDSRAPITKGDVITAERPGGRVRFPSGKVAKFKFSGQGMPRQGRQYLFFLKLDTERETYSILTAYELRAGKVFPIDGAIAAVGNKKWAFDMYTGAEQNRLLGDLQKEIANPSQKVIVY